ncbi:MAG: carboxypeptidase-like regulatory domain-containing protein, partial [Bacteroidia bacterium]|nr:carboxypeptidase-like regulatory domain-containing protein [Bacteroidia bacterium]
MRFFLFIFSSLFFQVVFSQELSQTIRGTVIDKQTQSPLPGAVVSILNTEPMKATTTDENGKFRFDNVLLGRKQLKISLISYKEKSQTVVLTTGKETVLNIELEESAVQGQEVVISAEIDKTKSNNKMATVSSR